MRLKIVITLLIATACNGTQETPKPYIKHAELFTLTETVEKQLYWCDGIPTGNRKNNIDGREHCDNGDGAYDLGLSILLGNIGDVNNFANFFNEQGQPFRAPSYVNKSTSNSFSRDQLTGFIAGATKTKNLTYLLKLKNYIDKNSKLCPDATDNRCDLNPAMYVLMTDALGLPVTKFERGLTDDSLFLDSQIVPGNYRAMLLAYQLFIKIEQGKVSQANKNAAASLSIRFPNNLMFKTLDAVMNKKSYDPIISGLITCLQEFKQIGGFYIFNRGNFACGNDANYWDIVALSHYVQVDHVLTEGEL